MGKGQDGEERKGEVLGTGGRERYSRKFAP